MLSFVSGQDKRPRKSIEHIRRRRSLASLLKPRIPGDARIGPLRDLLPSQAGRASSVAAEAERFGIEPFAASPQERRKVLQRPCLSCIVRCCRTVLHHLPLHETGRLDRFCCKRKGFYDRNANRGRNFLSRPATCLQHSDAVAEFTTKRPARQQADQLSRCDTSTWKGSRRRLGSPCPSRYIGFTVNPFTCRWPQVSADSSHHGMAPIVACVNVPVGASGAGSATRTAHQRPEDVGIPDQAHFIGMDDAWAGPVCDHAPPKCGGVFLSFSALSAFVSEKMGSRLCFLASSCSFTMGW